MKTSDIIKAIHKDFASVYRGASPFVNSGSLWDFCMDTISDPVAMSNIIFANDMGIPPVKSLLSIYKRRMNPPAGFEFQGNESQYMGALMAYVFKSVLRYKNQKERCQVNYLGIKTATRFFDGPIVKFELEPTSDKQQPSAVID